MAVCHQSKKVPTVLQCFIMKYLLGYIECFFSSKRDSHLSVLPQPVLTEVCKALGCLNPTLAFRVRRNNAVTLNIRKSLPPHSLPEHTPGGPFLPHAVPPLFSSMTPWANVLDLHLELKPVPTMLQALPCRKGMSREEVHCQPCHGKSP